MRHASTGIAKSSPPSNDVPFVGQSCPSSGNVDFPSSCRANGLSADDTLPNWSSLQTFSFLQWTSSLCRQVLSSCTPFACFLKRTLHIARLPEVASAKVLFPLPLPKVGVFQVSARAGSRERRRKAFDQAVHITVMALNFWHADFKFPPLDSLALTPSPSQADVLDGIRRMVKAFGSCEDTFEIPSSGRRSTSLISQLADLSDFVSWRGLAGASYSRGFKGSQEPLGAFMHVPVDKTRAPELVPYSSLNPERLKLAGSGTWDASKFLSDPLWMAFCEPSSLRWTSTERSCDVPDVEKEDYDAVRRLLKLWDVRGLLFLRDEPLPSDETDLSMRFFNCHKNISADRMIGDRRAMNFVEGTIPGASRCLPSALLLANLELKPNSEKVSIYISDRKDFYHQFKVSRERASSNALWPLIHRSDLEETFAFAAWCGRNLKKHAYDRLEHGDLFEKGGSSFPKKKSKVPEWFQGCFASIPQGDHLGVEFAVDAHRNLLKAYGLLCDDQELRSDRIFRGKKNASGLVIDDFYTVSVQDTSESHVSSTSHAQFLEAARAYADHQILGSEEKDVVGADKAKITGAELDTSAALRELNMATLASPAAKRLALAHVSLELAKMRWTTDQLHLCLIGGWVHSLLFRRPMMSLLDSSFGFVPNDEVRGDGPKLMPLTRAVAQELVLLAVLCPFMATDLTAKMSSTLYATDSSDKKGAIVAADIDEEVARALWRSGRKKGGYIRLLNRSQALLKKLDPDFEEPSLPGDEIRQHVERPLALRFHFLEICGGAGKVAAAVSRHGWNVGPVIDLDRSPFYDLRSLEVISWVFHLLERGLLDAFMIEPPCTTFSPAQHPASRGYDVPRGYDPTDPHTLTGTTLALRSLALMDVASDMECPSLLEQPRRTKMRRLEEWQRLLELGKAEEIWTASCMFGSIHNKEFIFLFCHLAAQSLHRKCDRSHMHVKVEGQFTKTSAVYADDLAEALAAVFSQAIAKKLRREVALEPEVRGLENPFCNDVLVSAKWRTVSVWTWRKPLHINILESRVVLSLLKKLALASPGIRQVVALDSNVGLSALAKGRSPSYGLRPCVRKTGATVIAGRLYPAYQFAPTRLNPADHPTRDNDFPPPLLTSLPSSPGLEDLLDFAEISMLSRPAANWIRLVVLMRGSSLPWFRPGECWRFGEYAFKHYPFRKAVAARPCHFRVEGFDSTLGFPGEGPFWNLPLGFPGLDFAGFCRWISLFSVWRAGWCVLLCCGGCLWCVRRRFWIFVGLSLFVPVGSCVSHGPVLAPRNPGDKRRAGLRSSVVLPEGRPVLGKTQVQRDRLLDEFDRWLREDGLSLESLIGTAEIDIELLNLQLERYGRSLFLSGRPYNHYAETINGVGSRRPRVRRLLQQAWDLAYAWVRQEPPCHHLALPWQALLSLVATAFYWGWIKEAGIIALSWGGLTRIGEALGAFRWQLVLPRDIEYTADYALLQINEPKTRYRAARHQVAKIDQPQLMAVLDVAFGRLGQKQPLWPYSGQTMRLRFQKLLSANGLDKLPKSISRGLDLGSLRAGGASWLMAVTDNPDLTRRRGRWITNKVMEIYVQEISAVQFIPNLPQASKRQITNGAALFPWMLEHVQCLSRMQIPSSVWPIFFQEAADKLVSNG